MAVDIPSSILALAVGITSSTAFVGMNSTIINIAFPSYGLPTIQNAQKSNASSSEKPPAQSSPVLLLRQWALTYRTGHAIGPTSLILSTVCFLYASRTCPIELRLLLYLGAVSAGLGFPFTIAFILQGNNELYRRADAIEASQDAEEQERLAGGDTQAMIAKCLWYSKLRSVMPVPAIAIGIYSIYIMAHGKLELNEQRWIAIYAVLGVNAIGFAFKYLYKIIP